MQDKPVFAKGYNLYKLFWIFMIGSFAGDVIETVFWLIKYHELTSRSSVIYGAFSVVWGMAAVLLTICLHKVSAQRDLYIFLYGTVLGGAYEYACSWLQEMVFGASFWDYSQVPFNLNGRINLLYCFFWGLISVVWVKNIYPYLSSLIERIPVKFGKVLTWILLIFMIFNMAVSALAINRMGERMKNIPPRNAVEEFIDTHYPDERVMEVYPKMKFVK